MIQSDWSAGNQSSDWSKVEGGGGNVCIPITINSPNKENIVSIQTRSN